MSAFAAKPDDLFDQMREHPDWDETERESCFQALIEKFPAPVLLSAALRRLDRLDSPEAEAALRIIEAHGSTEHFRAIAEALKTQPQLPVERAWEALSILDYVGILDEYPALCETWEEIAETLESSESLDELVEQIETEEDGPLLALHGLDSVEPDVRAEIIEGLGEFEAGPGLVEFLRLLTFTLEPKTREAALKVLEEQPSATPHLLNAWSSIAAEHANPEVVWRARQWLSQHSSQGKTGLPSRVGRPTLSHSAVTAVNGEGRGTVVTLAVDELSGAWTGAAYFCDVMNGVRDVVGHVGHDDRSAAGLFQEFADPSTREVVFDRETLTLGLLASILAVTGPTATPALRFWVEKTAGPAFRANPSGMLDLFGDWDPSDIPFAEIPERSELVLDCCPDWIDRSSLTAEIAQEIALRTPDADPDPRRDAGAYRYLFEHRLLQRLELYQRMLYWMAALWRAEGKEDLGRSAHVLAWQLADPQHAVPSHPFLQALSTRSLKACLIKRD